MAATVHAESGDSLLAKDYDFDLIVVGGGSGGLALAQEAIKHGQRVCLLDFVKPSEHGKTWGLGGTCVNVGCIPKKLMHQAALLGQAMQDSSSFGWSQGQPTFDWATCVSNINDYIGQLNFNYRKTLREVTVKYIPGYGKFIDRHTVEATERRGKVTVLKGLRICLAMGGRPRPLSIPGGKLAHTSDDVFSLTHVPGKTLVVGASYVALECAGFLAGMGFDVTVLVRSICLRGFDQEMAEKIRQNMETFHKVKFVYGVPTKLEKEGDGEDGAPPQIKVTYQKKEDGSEDELGVFNTVLNATGRDPCTAGMGLDLTGVELDERGFVKAENEQTNVWNILAIGDILQGKPELTPTAIQAGRLLARRLYNADRYPGQPLVMNYENVPTTVFTPLEYGCCGLSEEDAKARYGEENIEVYHDLVNPLEYVLGRLDEIGYSKVITLKTENEKVVGFHILSPNAGEITQGFAVALLVGFTKAQLDASVGIHPTCAETLTTISVTKRSGEKLEAGGC